MAEVKGARENTAQQAEPTRTVTWRDMKAGDVGSAQMVSAFAERSVQVAGEFGAKLGAKVLIEGSIDDKTFHLLNDPHGVPLELAYAGIHSISQRVVSIRPRIVGGDDTTKLSVVLLAGRFA